MPSGPVKICKVEYRVKETEISKYLHTIRISLALGEITRDDFEADYGGGYRTRFRLAFHIDSRAELE